MEFREKVLTAGDGTPLHARIGVIRGMATANVVLTHGRGEHSGRYWHVAEAMAERRIRLVTFDLRGHGRSGGKRGDVPSYASLLDDLQLLVSEVDDGATPLFLFGHSLGGQITLNYLIERQPRCRGAIIAAPYLRLAFRPERWRVALAHAVRWFWPSFTQRTVLAPVRLSRDAEHLASLPDPALIHDRISARMYHAVKRGAASAMAGASRVHVPLLLLHGAEDSVTSMEATREFHALAGASDKTLKIYPGMLHETHNEIGREQVLADILDWIEARLDRGP